MSHTAALVEVNCPLTSQLVIARKPKLLTSRVLPAVPKTPCAVLEGRSGYQVLTYWATMNECCLEIHGMYVGRSAAIIQRVISVHALLGLLMMPPRGTVPCPFFSARYTPTFGAYNMSYRYTISVRSLS